MSEPIYTDRDYLDTQFASIAAQFGGIHLRLEQLSAELPPQLRSVTESQRAHYADHRRFVGAAKWTAGIVVSIALAVAKISLGG